MSDVIVAPATRDLEILAAKLTAWMSDRMPEASGIRLGNFDYPKGAGQSHETILYDAEWNEGGAERAQGFVVRIKPSSFTVFPDNLFEQQYQLMKVLYDGEHVRVARPVWFEEDASVLGAPFFVMEKVQGRVPVSVPPYARSGWLADATPAQRRHLWEGAVRQLAALQHVPMGKVQFLAGTDQARDGLAQEWDKYTRFVDWVRDDPRSAILEEGRQRLLSLWPKNQPDGVVWGDARIGNIMFDDNFDVVAVMDWEQPSLGGALQDLGWFLTLSETMHGRTTQIGAHLDGMGSREETIALWENLSGKSAADVEWYEDFTQLKMSCTGVRMDMLRGTEMVKPEYMRARLKLG